MRPWKIRNPAGTRTGTKPPLFEAPGRPALPAGSRGLVTGLAAGVLGVLALVRAGAAGGATVAVVAAPVLAMDAGRAPSSSPHAASERAAAASAPAANRFISRRPVPIKTMLMYRLTRPRRWTTRAPAFPPSDH